MRERTVKPRLTFGKAAFAELFATLNLKTEADKARFLDVAESSFNRIFRGVMRPGEDFVACTMTAIEREPRLKDHPAANFQRLFPIEAS